MNRFVLDDKDIIILGEDGKVKNGGKGSGNFGHLGRPGEVGGSGDGLGSTSDEKKTKLSSKEKAELVQELESMIGTERDGTNHLYDEMNHTKEFKDYLQKSSAEFLVGLKNQLEQAREDGVDISNLYFGFVNESGVYGRTTTFGDTAVLKFSKAFMRGAVNTQPTENYWTNPTAAGLIRHELGHLKAFQECLKHGIKDARERKIYLATLAEESLGSKIKDIKESCKDRKQMSYYGGESDNIDEIFAESWANPDYSKTTKTLSDALRQAEISEKAKEELDKYYSIKVNALEKAMELCIGLTSDLEKFKALCGENGTEVTKSLNGGPGSGNFGHKGRPGKVGGSGGGVGKFLFNGDLPSKNPKPTKEGYVVVHHNTDNETANAIAKEGLVAGRNLGAYLVSPEEGLGIWTDSRAKTDSSYGGCTISFQIPKEEYEKYAVNDTQHLIPRNIAREDIVCIDKIINENGSNGKPIKVSNLKDNVDYYTKRGLDENKVISIIAKNSHGVITEQEIRELVDFKKKVANGGPGSGNFGHAGRPGLVGGSAPEGGLASSSARSRSFMLGDTIEVTHQGKAYVGELVEVHRDKKVDVEIDLPSGQKLTMKVPTLTIKQEDGTQIDLPARNLKMIQNVDASETPIAKRQTEKQKKALEEVGKMINISKAELNYLKTNCSEDSAVALRDELQRAKDDGIDLSQVQFYHNSRLTRTQGKVVYRAYTTGSQLPPLELQMSGKWIADGERYKEKQVKNYEDGWHTSSELAGILRHELGHVKTAQLALRLFDTSKEQDGKRVLTSQEVKYRNEKLCQEIVKKANQGYSVYSLSYGKGKDVSEYAIKDRSYAELVAESYSNSDFSEVTRNIVKTLDDESKNRKNSIVLKFENEAKMDDMDDSLCTGYPMSKEDWEKLHNKKRKETK